MNNMDRVGETARAQLALLANSSLQLCCETDKKEVGFS